LTRDPRLRPTTLELLNDEWIKSFNERYEIPFDIILDVSANLQHFRKYTVFQSGVIAYILSFYDGHGDFDELRKVFISLDKSQDGKLSIKEIN